MRFIQHKREAFWFYRFLSIFYDKLVNPLFWTPWMRDQSLQLGRLDEPDITVIDVGSGTGFTTEGIVNYVPGSVVTCVDQSPHQMARAKKKAALSDCTFIIGDAENIPVPTDSFDRYVSAGSIEYWPNPQKGINESYRVIKPGGIALMIGPLSPKTGFARFMAQTWMLFPTLDEYLSWYKNAGFENISYKFIRPHWYRDSDGYGVAIVGEKKRPGDSPDTSADQLPNEQKDKVSLWSTVRMIVRLTIGSLAGFIFIPIALLGYLWNSFNGQTDRPEEYRERLNRYQIGVLVLIFAFIIWLVFRLL